MMEILVEGVQRYDEGARVLECRASENAALQLNAPVAAGTDTSAGERSWKGTETGFPLTA